MVSQIDPLRISHWYWIAGDPLAVTFKLKLPPVHIEPPMGSALMTISGLTATMTVELKISSQPL